MMFQHFDNSLLLNAGLTRVVFSIFDKNLIEMLHTTPCHFLNNLTKDVIKMLVIVQILNKHFNNFNQNLMKCLTYTRCDFIKC